jgi:hypothetical protein
MKSGGLGRFADALRPFEDDEPTGAGHG